MADVIDTALVDAAKKEGAISSAGMPDSWANWKGTWAELTSRYGLKHTDRDMSSAQQLAGFETDRSGADIGDVGDAFGSIAVARGVTQPFKPSTWDQIPAWAKDADGHWMLAYTGTIAFIVDKQMVKEGERPATWHELERGGYTVTIGDVGTAAQASVGVLAAAIAYKGDESNIAPGLQLFTKLAQQKRLSLADPTLEALKKGEIEVGVLWDFNALSYRDHIDPDRFEVRIPSDGSVISGYSTIINKHAKNPNAAKLAREFIFSDAGQLNLARGHARPIRAEHVELPVDVQAKLLPNQQYGAAQPIKNAAAWESTLSKLSGMWQEQVIIEME